MTRVAKLTTTKKPGQQLVFRTTKLVSEGHAEEIEIKVCIEDIQRGKKARLVIHAPTCITIEHINCEMTESGECHE